MPSVFKRTYTVVDPKTGRNVRRKTRKWYVEYRAADGSVHRRPGYTDKEATVALGRRLERQSARRKEGLIDPHEDQAKRPLADHVAEYGRYLAAKGDSERHVGITVSRLQAIVAGCGFQRIPIISASKLVAWLAEAREKHGPLNPLAVPTPQQPIRTYHDIARAFGVSESTLYYWKRHGAPITRKGPHDLRAIAAWYTQWLSAQSGLSIRTSNYYLTAMKGFCRWLVRERRMADNPLTHLETLNAETDIRRRRRVLPADELLRLLAAARNGEPIFGLSGPDRSMLYLTATYTGLRAGELASLTPASFAFDANPPTVTVQAAYSKHRRQDMLPLRKDLAETLRVWLSVKPTDHPCWPGPWPGDAAEMMREDLTAAGIPYRDAADRVFDFHALRHQFVSSLAQSGVHPKTAQALARHSTITLTLDRYTHVDFGDLTAALDRLPGLTGGTTKQESSQTDSERPLAGLLAGAGDVPRHAVTADGTPAPFDEGTAERSKSLSGVPFGTRCHPDRTGDQSAPSRIRTCNLRIRSPLLYPLSYGRGYRRRADHAANCIAKIFLP